MGCQIALSDVEIRDKTKTRALKTFKIMNLLEEMELAKMMKKHRNHERMKNVNAGP